MLITIIFTLALCSVVSAANYTVGPNSTSYNYISIKSAVAAANNGDSIIVYPNNSHPYTENINIAHNLTIKASGHVIVQSLNPASSVFSVNSGGSGTTIQGFIINGPSMSGINLNTNNCKIINNTIINCDNGINGQYNTTEITGNTISYTGTAYSYGIYSDGRNNKISGNKITFIGTGSADSRGIHVWGSSYKISGNTVNVTTTGSGGSFGINLNNKSNDNNNEISGNIISVTATTGNKIALDFGSDVSSHAFGNTILSGSILNYGTDNHLNYNRINISSTITNNNAKELDAQYNWYGDNFGPGFGIINGNITCDRWLMMNIIATNKVNTYQTIKIIADFTHDSYGDTVNPSLINFPGTVSFTSTLATISSTAAVINGQAQATFYSGKILGTSTITAKLDDQTQNTVIKIVDTIAPKIIITYPKNKAKKVSRTKIIYLKFSENILVSNNWSKITIKKNGKKIKITKSIKNNILSLKTKKRSKYATYTVYIPSAAIKDIHGNKLNKYYTFKFKTGK